VASRPFSAGLTVEVEPDWNFGVPLVLRASAACEERGGGPPRSDSASGAVEWRFVEASGDCDAAALQETGAEFSFVEDDPLDGTAVRRIVCARVPAGTRCLGREIGPLYRTVEVWFWPACELRCPTEHCEPGVAECPPLDAASCLSDDFPLLIPEPPLSEPGPTVVIDRCIQTPHGELNYNYADVRASRPNSAGGWARAYECAWDVLDLDGFPHPFNVDRDGDDLPDPDPIDRGGEPPPPVGIADHCAGEVRTVLDAETGYYAPDPEFSPNAWIRNCHLDDDRPELSRVGQETESHRIVVFLFAGESAFHHSGSSIEFETTAFRSGSLILHELFHCFQDSMQRFPSESVNAGLRLAFTEGEAAALDEWWGWTEPRNPSSSQLKEFTPTHTGFTDRSYTNIGFYSFLRGRTLGSDRPSDLPFLADRDDVAPACAQYPKIARTVPGDALGEPATPYDPANDLQTFPGQQIDIATPHRLRIGETEDLDGNDLPDGAQRMWLPGVPEFWVPLLRRVGEEGLAIPGRLLQSWSAMHALDAALEPHLDPPDGDGAVGPGVAWREYMRWQLSECGPTGGCERIDPAIADAPFYPLGFYPGAGVPSPDFDVDTAPDQPPWWSLFTADLDPEETITRVFGQVEVPFVPADPPFLRIRDDDEAHAWARVGWIEFPDFAQQELTAVPQPNSVIGGLNFAVTATGLPEAGPITLTMEVHDFESPTGTDLDFVDPLNPGPCGPGDPIFFEADGEPACLRSAEEPDGIPAEGLHWEVIDWSEHRSPTRPIRHLHEGPEAGLVHYVGRWAANYHVFPHDDQAFETGRVTVRPLIANSEAWVSARYVDRATGIPEPWSTRVLVGPPPLDDFEDAEFLVLDGFRLELIVGTSCGGPSPTPSGPYLGVTRCTNPREQDFPLEERTLVELGPETGRVLNRGLAYGIWREGGQQTP